MCQSIQAMVYPPVDNEASPPEDPRRHGQEKAKERERVRCAGRRIVVFPERDNVKATGKQFECVQKNRVVEGSFAKGEWGVRVVSS